MLGLIKDTIPIIEELQNIENDIDILREDSSRIILKICIENAEINIKAKGLDLILYLYMEKDCTHYPIIFKRINNNEEITLNCDRSKNLPFYNDYSYIFEEGYNFDFNALFKNRLLDVFERYNQVLLGNTLSLTI